MAQTIRYEEVPYRTGYITEIHLCSKCKVAADCESLECKEKGWCHTFKKKEESNC